MAEFHHATLCLPEDPSREYTRCRKMCPLVVSSQYGTECASVSLVLLVASENARVLAAALGDLRASR